MIPQSPGEIFLLLRRGFSCLLYFILGGGCALETAIKVLWDAECIRSSIYRELIQGIKKAALKSHYSVDVYPNLAALQDNMEQATIIVVIGYESPKLQHSISEILKEHKQVLLAGLDADRFGNKVSSVSPSRSQATAQMVNYLLQCERRSIAMVGCDRLSLNDMIRCDTMKQILHSHGCRNPENNIFYFQTDLYESFHAFLRKKDEFDAVICPNDYTALCFLRFCQDKGIVVPDDLYLTAFSNRFVSLYCSPSITTTAVDFQRIGEYTIFAWQFLQAHASENLQIQLQTPSKLMIRDSTYRKPYSTQEEYTLDYDTRYEGGVFYTDKTIQSVMRIENCLASSNLLDLQIIHLMLKGESYESIAEKAFISRNGVKYRIKQIFELANVRSRKEFIELFQQYFTYENNFAEVLLQKQE